MKIFSAEQIRQWDQFTIEHEPVASIDLMERAAQSFTDWIFQNNLIRSGVKIFCGKGNNGGDGLAIARQLIQQGIFAKVYILEFGNPGTSDFQENLHRLHQYTTDIYFIQDESFFPTIDEGDLLVDALYGSGLNRGLKDLSAALVSYINESTTTVVSIDVPSGMFINKSSKGEVVIRSQHTLTFQSIKLCFLMPENEILTGDLHILNIGLHPEYEINTDAAYNYIDGSIAYSLYKKRTRFSHKGTFGHALIAGGSTGKMGAAYLASKACLRSGAGLLTSLVPAEGLNIIQTLLPEAMCLTTDQLENIDLIKYASIGVGPGLGTDNIELLQFIMQHYNKPIVFDADALNMLASNKHLLKQIPKHSVLTPHPKEFERLFGHFENDFERMDAAITNAQQFQCYIILKGHHSFISCPNGKGFFNSTGNAGMATGGSGDVLTGIITGLLSQSYSPEAACILGVYLHGLAGDIAANCHSQEGMIAGDIIECLGQAFLTFTSPDTTF